MPIPWEKLVAARKLIKLDRKQKRKEKRAAIREERRRRAEESSRSRRRTSSSRESSTTSSSSVLSSSPSRKRSRRSVTPPQASEVAAGAPKRPQPPPSCSVTPPVVVGEPPQRPQQPQQPKSPEVKVVGSKPAPKRERQVEVSRKEAGKIPPLPLPVAQPPPPAVPPPPQQQKKPAAAVEPIREVEVQGRIKRGLQVKVTNPEAEARSADHSRKKPAKERLGSPVKPDREEVIERLRGLAAAGSSSSAEARPPSPRGAEADRHRRVTKEYPSVLEQEAYAVVPVHLSDFRTINDVVERMQTLRHPTLRNEIVKFRNVLLRRLNDQALGPEAQRLVQSYCHKRK